MKVGEIMTEKVASVRQEDTLSTAARIMWECDCGALPVLDPAGEHAVGMITDRDICMAVWSKNRAPSSIRVAEVTSRELYACKQDDSLTTAEDLMCSKQIRRIPVLDERDKLVGILSLADIAKASQHSNSTGAFARDIAPTEVATTLGSICSPHPNPGL